VRQPAVFLDRDGVLNELVSDPVSGLAESPLRPEDVRLIAGAVEALRELRTAGYRLACITNQPAAAKGVVSIAQLLSVQARVAELLGESGVRLDAVRMCLHHPDGVRADLSVSCRCRKPQPGMLLSVASELGAELSNSWMVGDTDADVGAGQAAGCQTVLVETKGSAHKRAGTVAPDAVALDLGGAARIVVPSSRND
jgi:D-glycero-D-manno-heptose 1,7-bisphosphate phosphatase